MCIVINVCWCMRRKGFVKLQQNAHFCCYAAAAAEKVKKPFYFIKYRISPSPVVSVAGG